MLTGLPLYWIVTLRYPLIQDPSKLRLVLAFAISPKLETTYPG